MDPYKSSPAMLPNLPNQGPQSAAEPRQTDDLTQTRRIENLRAAMAQALDSIGKRGSMIPYPLREHLNTAERLLSKAIAADEAAEERMIRERKATK